MAYKSYMNHMANCSICRGSYMCSEGRSLYNAWQSYVTQLQKAKAALEAAKRALSEAKTAERRAKSRLRAAIAALNWVSNQQAKAEALLAQIEKDIADKIVELTKKRKEHGKKAAEEEAAKGEVDNAIDDLKRKKESHPDEYNKIVGDDPEKKQLLEEIFNEME